MKRTNSTERQLVRAALRIHEQLTSPTATCELPALPEIAWEDIRSTTARLQTLRSRGWHKAYASVLDDLIYVLGRMQREIEQFQDNLPTICHHSCISIPHEIVRDLEAL